MSARPKILLVGLELHWPATARLPRALQSAGFEVGVACHARAFLAHTKFRDHFFRLPDKNHGQGILAGIKTIISAWPPDLVLPMDDWTALFLTRVHEQLVITAGNSGLATLLRHSLGNPFSTAEALSKRRTMEIARDLGVRAPASRTITSTNEVLEFGREHGFPVVLKLSYSGGGKGVVVCRSQSEIPSALAFLRREESFKSRRRSWREQFSGRVMETRWLPKDRTITANRFIAGKCATSVAAAVGGEMLGALTAEVEQTYLDANGPASVIRLVHNEEMRRASEKMLKHWGLTGLIGFDFILDPVGAAWLIECNPRPTPLAHLGARVGEDVCVALHHGLVAGQKFPQTNALVEQLTVAHFPQESWRDPNSPYFASAFHDVPADDLDLMNHIRQIAQPKRNN